ncbi:MAG: class I SAM-dependent methyltransferase [Opitutae bacterium]
MKARDWDQLAAAYDDEVCDIFVRDRKKVIARWLRARGLLRGNKTLLDLGCGIGSFFQRYGRHFGEKTGTDHSRRMLQIAARRCRAVPACHWQQADARGLPPALRDYADLVVCSNVITFVSAAACHRAMRETVRGAKPGGWLLFILPALESHDAVVALESGRPIVRRKSATAIVRRDDRMQRFYTAAGARQLATRAGLKSIAVQKVWYPWSDEGLARPPRGQEPPWDWMLTARR